MRLHCEQTALAVPGAPSISGFRRQIADLVKEETASGRRRDIIVLGVDGVRHRDGLEHWRGSHTRCASSVFPTTSSSAWLSSLSGEPVWRHGVAGVVFRVAGQSEPIHIFEYQGPLPGIQDGNLFSDATLLGYRAVAILGDLQPLECTWRDRLLENALVMEGEVFFAQGARRIPEPEELGLRLARLLAEAPVGPRLVWLFLDLDHYIHRHGYDSYVARFLVSIGRFAESRAAAHDIVVAYSDHGLIRTIHDPNIERCLDEAAARWEASIGGAGRVRWLDVSEDQRAELREHLRTHLPASVRVLNFAEAFGCSPTLLPGVGSVVLVATGECFLAPSGYTHEHGSWESDEIYVPVSVWGLRG